MAKQYRVNAFVRINNSIISSLLHLGLSMGSFALLTVCGRKSGKPIETPIAIFNWEGKSYLISPYGIVNWVRNLRAAGGEATITRSRRTALYFFYNLRCSISSRNPCCSWGSPIWLVSH
jgi:hypothetical protein